jgi:hypothetical protein
MPNEVPLGEAAAAPQPPARTFRKYAPPSSLSPEQCRRQTEVLRAACDKLFPRGTAIAFLNSHNAKLGGKPLQLALDSDDGLLRVEQLIARMSKAEAERGANS